eukprot:1139264-Pelagomonas_calceolata.AAC.4
MTPSLPFCNSSKETLHELLGKGLFIWNEVSSRHVARHHRAPLCVDAGALSDKTIGANLLHMFCLSDRVLPLAGNHLLKS